MSRHTGKWNNTAEISPKKTHSMLLRTRHAVPTCRCRPHARRLVDWPGPRTFTDCPTPEIHHEQSSYVARTRDPKMIQYNQSLLSTYDTNRHQYYGSRSIETRSRPDENLHHTTSYIRVEMTTQTIVASPTDGSTQSPAAAATVRCVSHLDRSS